MSFNEEVNCNLPIIAKDSVVSLAGDPAEHANDEDDEDMTIESEVFDGFVTASSPQIYAVIPDEDENRVPFDESFGEKIELYNEPSYESIEPLEIEPAETTVVTTPDNGAAKLPVDDAKTQVRHRDYTRYKSRFRSKSTGGSNASASEAKIPVKFRDFSLTKPRNRSLSRGRSKTPVNEIGKRTSKNRGRSKTPTSVKQSKQRSVKAPASRDMTPEEVLGKVKSRELKSLMDAAKESNLDTNIVHKRESRKNTDVYGVHVPPVPPTARRSSTGSNDSQPNTGKKMRSQNAEFLAKHQRFLSRMTLFELGSDNDGFIQDETVTHHKDKESTAKVNKRKRDGANESIADGATVENVKKRRKSMSKTGAVAMKKDKDKFCWHCHRDGATIFCETCPRSYHMRCLKNTVPTTDHWPCPECLAILHAESTKTRSPALRDMSQENLCELLKFAVMRMLQCVGAEPFVHPVDVKIFPDYSTYVVQPMDLTTLQNNIRDNLYGSTVAFLADAKWILHNSIIYNSYQSKLTSVAKSMIKVVKHEMVEIETCAECYLNANTKLDSWFVEVCSKPHMVVWAKLKGFPYWPAKAMVTNSAGLVDVRFFGAHDRAWVPIKECYLYSLRHPNTVNKTRRTSIEECIKEVDVHIEKLAAIYGPYEYPPYRIPYDPARESEQFQMLFPQYKAAGKPPSFKISPGFVKHEIEAKSPKKKSRKSRALSEPKDHPTKVDPSKSPPDTDDKTDTNDSKLNCSKEDFEKFMEGYGTEDEESEMQLNTTERKKIISTGWNSDSDDEPVAKFPSTSSLIDVQVNEETDELDIIGSGVILGRTKVRTRGGYHNVTGRVRVHVGSAEKSQLKRPLTDDTEEDVQPKVSKLELCLTADPGKINLVKSVAENHTGEEMRPNGLEKFAHTENSEHIVLLDNHASPPKTSIADKLIKKITEVDMINVEAVKKQILEDLNKMGEQLEVNGTEAVKRKTLIIKDTSAAVNPVAIQRRSDSAESTVKSDVVETKPVRNCVTSDMNANDKPTGKGIGDANVEAKAQQHVDVAAKSIVIVSKSDFGALPTTKVRNVKENSCLLIPIAPKPSDVAREPAKAKTLAGCDLKMRLISIEKGNAVVPEPKPVPIAPAQKKNAVAETPMEVDDSNDSSSLKASMVKIVDVLDIISGKVNSKPLASRTSSRKSSKEVEDSLNEVVEIKSEPRSEEESDGETTAAPTDVSIRAEDKIQNSTTDTETAVPSKSTVANVPIDKLSNEVSANRKELTVKPLSKLVQPIQQKARKTFPSSANKTAQFQIKKIMTEKREPARQGTATKVSPHVPAQQSGAKVSPQVASQQNSAKVSPQVNPQQSGAKVSPQVTKDNVMYIQTPTPALNSLTLLPPNTPLQLQQPSSVGSSIITMVPHTIAIHSQSLVIQHTPCGTQSFSNPSAATTTTTQCAIVVPSTEVQAPPCAAPTPEQLPTATVNDISSCLPDGISKSIGELMCRKLPKLKPRPPGPLSSMFDEGSPSSAGPATKTINSVAHRLSDYFRGLLKETLSDLSEIGNPEAKIRTLELELETLKHKHAEEMLELKKNISTILKDIQKSIVVEKAKVIEETRAGCEAERVRCIEETKIKTWCVTCLKEANFYCCWNTSYCDYACQQKHWSVHMKNCANPSLRGTASEGTTTIPISTASSPAITLNPKPTLKNTYQNNKTLTKTTARMIVKQGPGKGPTMYLPLQRPYNSAQPTLTLVESTPGNFEIVSGNTGPISIGGKLISNPSLISKLNKNVIPVSSSAITNALMTQKTLSVSQKSSPSQIKPANKDSPAPDPKS